MVWCLTKSHSLQDRPLTQNLTPKFNIYAWYITRITNNKIPLSLYGIMYFLNDYCRENTLIETYPNNAMLWKESPKRYPYFPIQQKKIPLSQICTDLSLTPKKAPFSENFRTHMLTHIVKVVPPGVVHISHSWCTSTPYTIVVVHNVAWVNTDRQTDKTKPIIILLSSIM